MVDKTAYCSPYLAMKPQHTKNITNIIKQNTSVHERFDNGPLKFLSYLSASPVNVNDKKGKKLFNNFIILLFKSQLNWKCQLINKIEQEHNVCWNQLKLKRK